MVIATSTFVSVGLIWLGMSAAALIGWLIVITGARRAEERERRRLAELHAAKELSNRVPVIGGGNAHVPGDERWAA
jgi:hypothetical protein